MLSKGPLRTRSTSQFLRPSIRPFLMVSSKGSWERLSHSTLNLIRRWVTARRWCSLTAFRGTDMGPITAKELNSRLKKEKMVDVCGMSFRIRCAPLMFLGDESDDFWTIARQGKESLQRRIQELIQNPRLPQFRRVLMNGIISPKVTALEGDGDFVGIDS